MLIKNKLNKLASNIEFISGLLLGVMTLTIFLSAFIRYVFPFALPDGYDISRHLLGVAVMWGLATACYTSDHIKVDILYSAVGNKLKRVFDGVSELIILVFVSVLSWKISTSVVNAYDSNLLTVDLGLPIWPGYFLLWLGTMAATLMALCRFLVVITEKTENNDMIDAGHYYE